ncbi:hypothetical protein [Rhodococcus opacus]|uniref:hypothetical protein n=1 Tax=Rhodococcus opacus TaxID=37919 RepID=UPI0013D9B491|nr:hypothetical protein [Rhodococcus opacus]MDV7090277.1 hypothetical protein [Rhodococcus opacus]
MTVDVRAWGRPARPCVAGAVDRRDTRPDGTVLDLLDTCRAADAPIGGSIVPMTWEQIEYLATAPELDVD